MKRKAAPLLPALLAAACAGRTPPPTQAPAPPAPASERAAPSLPPEPPPIPRGQAPPPGPYAPGFDAVSYAFAVALPDTGTYIRASALELIALREPRQDTLRLDLTGLAVTAVRVSGPGLERVHPVDFVQRGGKVLVPVPDEAGVGQTFFVNVDYEGHVDDGLILRRNVHGHWTAFGDDWPNRARFWLPVIDHPSDKATVSWAVSAPAAWRVVANGVRSDTLGPDAPGLPHVIPAPDPPEPPPGSFTPRAITRWGEAVPIPPYLMVVGAGDMAVTSLGRACGPGLPPRCVPLEGWSFPEDSANAARIFAPAPDILAYFAALVGPFAYEKLDHVQSATMFGGMENATAIFYDEKAVANGTLSEETVAHETAHQWFGDAVTEARWADLWLSEGFATYFAALWTEHSRGQAAFRDVMQAAARRYWSSDVTDRPVIDTAQTDLMELLDRNSYQKGAWVLHMLRGTLGDSAFFTGIRRYYVEHRNGTALTPDLRAAMENASGRELGWFFDQWLRRPGFPQLTYDWRWDARAREAVVTLAQVQSSAWPTFRLPLTLEFGSGSGAVRRTATLEQRTATLRFRLPARPTSLRVDPDGALLLQIVAAPPAPGGS